MKILSSEQIQQLFQFCEKHCVRYYDVQVELVDHLASAIETEMSNNPNITFDDCLQKEYKGFGATGFGKYMSEKEKQITRSFQKERNEILMHFFTPPKVFLVLIIAIILMYPFYTMNLLLSQIVAATFCIIIPIGLAVFVIYQYQQKKKRSHKLYQLDSGINFVQSILLGLSINISGQLFARFLPDGDVLPKFNFSISLFLVFVGYVFILITIASYYQYQSILEKSKKEYPLAFK